MEEERVHPETRAEWRAWLAEHHTRDTGIWLVWWRTHTGRLGVTYDEAVEEALCFAWIDSKARRIDDDRTAMWMSPRRRGSGWSRPNKARIARLEEAGLVAPAGGRMIEAAQADGSWTLFDEVEELIVPPDLDAAFAGRPGAAETWDDLPRSVRRATLAWIVTAKRPETRARRITETARDTAAGVRPHGL